jgi:chromosome segregation protein
MARAVDAALGPWRDAYVASGDDALVEAAHAVKAMGSGGVSFVTERPGANDTAAAVAAEFGVERLADRLGPRAERSLAEAYIGNVVLVEGWKTAHTVVAASPEIIAVTPEGDVIAAHGMVVAHPDGAGPAALEAARVDAEIAERDLKRYESHLTAATRAFDAARTSEREALEALESAEVEIAGHTEALAMVDRSKTASQSECERLVARVDAIDDAADARAERISELRARVAEFEGEEAARQEAWDALNLRRQQVGEQREAARRSVEEIAAERASIVERRRLSEHRLASVGAEIAQLTLIPESADGIGRLRDIETAAETAGAGVSVHIETLRERQRVLRDQVGTANSELSTAEAQREALDERRRESADALAALDVELAELRVRLEATAEGLRRDVQAEEQDALDAPRPEVAEGVDMRDRLESLEADLRRMGPINPLAAQEHAELAAQVEELEQQLADLNESRDEINKVVAALDEKMEGLFVEAFDEIARLYHENFSLVFPGGAGSLRLTDPDDPLNTGVLVEAQPAGKKVGRLSLLSGGERSLAALAFLFAVFRARPSPFYVLDEVEAALDDANLHRFLRLVDTLRRDTQLVIITHQQQTMEAADVLYGVTMEPGDSSKVLSKRMTPVSV